jgi:hypothetical protein
MVFQRFPVCSRCSLRLRCFCRSFGCVHLLVVPPDYVGYRSFVRSFLFALRSFAFTLVVVYGLRCIARLRCHLLRSLPGPFVRWLVPYVCSGFVQFVFCYVRSFVGFVDCSSLFTLLFRSLTLRVFRVALIRCSLIRFDCAFVLGALFGPVCSLDSFVRSFAVLRRVCMTVRLPFVVSFISSFVCLVRSLRFGCWTFVTLFTLFHYGFVCVVCCSFVYVPLFLRLRSTLVRSCSLFCFTLVVPLRSLRLVDVRSLLRCVSVFVYGFTRFRSLLLLRGSTPFTTTFVHVVPVCCCSRSLFP